MPAPPEIIAIGELLIDLISLDYAANFREATRYERLPGGSPANLAMNCARLGRRVALVATVGDDDAGTLLTEAAAATGVDVSAVARHPEPTTLILVTKSREVSDFEAYRMADRHLTPAQLAGAPLAAARIVHTTAFALSREPARGAILEALRAVAAAGGTVSLDYNYAAKIWGGDRAAGLAVLETICRETRPLVKVSETDFERLFETMVIDYHSAAQRILDLGARLVCLSLGEEGSYLLGDGVDYYLPARPVEVRDTTGAGDAYWSAFLTAHLAGYGWEDCARAGRGLAERKLAVVGPYDHEISLVELID